MGILQFGKTLMSVFVAVSIIQFSLAWKNGFCGSIQIFVRFGQSLKYNFPVCLIVFNVDGNFMLFKFLQPLKVSSQISITPSGISIF